MLPVTAVILVLAMVLLVTILAFRRAHPLKRRVHFFYCVSTGPAVWLLSLGVSGRAYPSYDTVFCSLGVLSTVAIIAAISGTLIAALITGMRDKWNIAELVDSGVIRIPRHIRKKSEKRQPELLSPASDRLLLFCAECRSWTPVNYAHNHSRRA